MIVLALDSTTRAGSVAVVADGSPLCERAGDPTRTHGERLPLDLMKVLGEAGVRVNDVDLFAVAAGPGSFTGLRVGISAIQGLAMALGRTVVPVSTLEALACVRDSEGALVAPWMDAQRGQVFAALYESDGRSRLEEPTAETPEVTLGHIHRRTGAARIRFIGDGALRYADRITRSLGARAAIVGEVPLLAGVIGRIAAAAPDRAVLPHAVAPLYVRRPDAEIARERQIDGHRR